MLTAVRAVAVTAVLLAFGGNLATAGSSVGPKKTARAQNRLNNFWGRADYLYGADGKAAPLYTVGGPSTDVQPTTAGTPIVEIPDGLMAKLGARTHGVQKGQRERRQHLMRWVKNNLLHEWAHVYQSPATLSDISTREQGAVAFAHAARRALRHNTNVDPSLITQFGSNYGMDPTQINWWTEWPGTPAPAARRQYLQRNLGHP